jgi:receptor protein-tyrosine kinase
MSGPVKEGRKVLAITSAAAGDGRTHVAANLAASLAIAGWRVLLVDADLRRPKQHLVFNVPQHPGLSRLLCGFAPKEVVRAAPDIANLSLVTAGPVPPDPLDLLSRGEFRAFLEQAINYYDVILIDTPAGSECLDAEIIASTAGSALIIVQKNKTRQRDAQSFVERLEKSGVQTVGTLMNEH